MRQLKTTIKNYSKHSTRTVLPKDISISMLEGSCTDIQEQSDDLTQLLLDSGAKNILEIGFYNGLSSKFFLKASKHTKVVSFDIASNSDIDLHKRSIDTIFPNRHTLIKGDTTITLPKFNTETKFDLIFIDGGHSEQVATADILNCKKNRKQKYNSSS